MHSLGYWNTVKDGDARAFALYSRHYSFHHYADNRRSNQFYRNRHLVMGPGEKMILLTADCATLFGWRKFKDDSGQTGVNCAFFRNEGPVKSSTLIREAMALAWLRWPGERLYTYVNQGKIKSVNPGYCFKMAGWQSAGKTKSGLAILAVLPTN